MVIYYKVSDLKNNHADKISMHSPYINGTTIANTSLFSKTLGMMKRHKCLITATDSAYYINNSDNLSRLEFKKTGFAELLPDLWKRKTLFY